MRYKLFGRTGLRVSELCLGTMTFGESWGMGANKETSSRIFDAFLEAGGNFIDTANGYTQGESEQFLGDFIKGRREQVVLATKYTLNMKPDDPNSGGNQRKNMFQSIEGSLKRLKTDYIDVFWVHIWDGMTPIAEIMRGLDDLVKAGKVLHIGFSDVPAWLVAQANTMADLRGWTPFSGIQVQYNLIERTVERDLLPMARNFDLAVTAWSPLCGGLLSGKYKSPTDLPTGSRHKVSDWGASYLTEHNFRICEEVHNVAKELAKTPSQISLAWLLSRRDMYQVIPILGARKLDQLKENLGCLDVKIPEPFLQRLDNVSHIELGFPNDFLKHARSTTFGNTYDRIDNHHA
ncbi:MAG: aldo/keto reductase [Candidatus Riflebacteria bacterium]|nr:aldo/keto reductase [Candidatus Riflebacteria bacterium]